VSWGGGREAVVVTIDVAEEVVIVKLKESTEYYINLYYTTKTVT